MTKMTIKEYEELLMGHAWVEGGCVGVTWKQEMIISRIVVTLKRRELVKTLPVIIIQPQFRLRLSSAVVEEFKPRELVHLIFECSVCLVRPKLSSKMERLIL